jgi:hypothetical protein
LRAPQGEFVGHGYTSLSQGDSTDMTILWGVLFPDFGNFLIIIA